MRNLIENVLEPEVPFLPYLEVTSMADIGTVIAARIDGELVYFRDSLRAQRSVMEC